MGNQVERDKLSRLTDRQDWSKRWGKSGSGHSVAFDISAPFFRDMHKVLKTNLPSGGGLSVLEVGAYPGAYLWYFNKYYGYTPWGVEYVSECARTAKENLKELGVDARMLAKDFFDLSVEEDSPLGGWDITTSFGFVEHFEDPVVPVQKHLEITRPGGYVAISIPNHSGLNGSILKRIDKQKYEQHNRMTLDDLEGAFRKAGRVEIVLSAHIGHLGLWNAGVYPRLRNILGAMYPVARGPLWLIEQVGQWVVPNNGWSSPDCIVIARKIGP